MRSPVRLERRLEQPKWLNWVVPLGSLVAALILGAIVLWITGKNPFDVYQRIFERGFAGKRAFSGALEMATPLAFTGLCAAVAFRMGLVNIGGEGQFYMGAVGASYVGISLGGSPTGITIALMCLGGMVFGSVYAAIVGVLRARFNTNEIITSLMMNYLAAIFLNYLIFNSKSFWRDPDSPQFPKGKTLNSRADWNTYSIFGINLPIAFLIALLAGSAVWVLYKRTRFGFEVGILADSPKAARYAGIRTTSTIVIVMALSGALAGLGGAADVGNFRGLLDAKGIQMAGYGYTGIVVAALARRNPLVTVVVAIFIGGLTKAGYALQGPDFPSGLVGTLQGLILFTAVAGEILIKYRIRTTPRRSEVVA
ncbi:MAG: ABC transporter permease [Ilumatobacteraceae bacterium]|nr:ABC transporter permease [Ilumatobacteraceae bacterium]MBJ7425544.1 ABC transporter permease [Ilumatobacteraceae bacterium]